MSLKSRVEAVLFLTDKPMPAGAVAKLVNEDVQLVRQAIMQLIFDYEQRDCALEISDDDDGYMMQVKDEFANLANDLAPIDLPVAVVRTLSAIAIKQPVMQSDIVRIRGAGAYEHITTLLEKELITKKEEGRSPLLSTTKKFQEYFRLSQDAKALRSQLKDQDIADKAEAIDQQLELPLANDPLLPIVPGQEIQAALDPAQIEASQIEASQATMDAQILADNIAESQNLEATNDTINQASDQSTETPAAESSVESISESSTESDTEQFAPPSPTFSGVADWSSSTDSVGETINVEPTSNGRSKKKTKVDNNSPVTGKQFIAATPLN